MERETVWVMDVACYEGGKVTSVERRFVYGEYDVTQVLIMMGTGEFTDCEQYPLSAYVDAFGTTEAVGALFRNGEFMWQDDKK